MGLHQIVPKVSGNKVSLNKDRLRGKGREMGGHVRGDVGGDMGGDMGGTVGEAHRPCLVFRVASCIGCSR